MSAWILILFATTRVLGQTYNCPSTCQPPACVCASTQIPGGIALADTPMFITLTFDDAIQSPTMEAWRKWLNSTINRNGCYLPATFFVSNMWTEYDLVTRTFNEGHEIAGHTVNHYNQANITTYAAEIKSGRDALNAFSGIPRSKLIGFRHPFLSFNKKTYDAVFAAGFQYESSVTLDPNTQPYWPHTLDYGFPYSPQPCGTCNPADFVYPGKWVIPMYSILNTQNQLWTTMDPVFNIAVDSTYQDALANLKYSFKLHYSKKLPFGLYQHAAQFIASGPQHQENVIKMLSEFTEWTLSQFPDTWYVTNQQLIQWIQSPVPSSKMQDTFPCVPPAVDKSNREICDGIDNDSNGIVDDGLTLGCSVNGPSGPSSFRSCYGCPSQMPNTTNAVPSYTGGRFPVPDAGCPDKQTWDPVAGQCVFLVRPIVYKRDGTVATPQTNTIATQTADSGMPVWEIAVISVVSSIVGLAGVFFIYRYFGHRLDSNLDNVKEKE